MTQRKDEMPDEIYIFNKPIKYYKKVRHSYYTSTAGYKDEMTKYTRADLSPPVPDDVAHALEIINNDDVIHDMAIGAFDLMPEIAEKYLRTIIRAASTPQLTKSPESVSKQELTNADDVTVSREVLQGVRGFVWDAEQTLYEINPSNYDHDEVCRLNNRSVEACLILRELLTSLDAVLEGKP